MQVVNEISENKQQIDDFAILREFKDVFPDELPSLLPMRDIDFTIDLVPGVVLVSKAPYRMHTPELIELKI